MHVAWCKRQKGFWGWVKVLCCRRPVERAHDLNIVGHSTRKIWAPTPACRVHLHRKRGARVDGRSEAGVLQRNGARSGLTTQEMGSWQWAARRCCGRAGRRGRRVGRGQAKRQPVGNRSRSKPLALPFPAPHLHTQLQGIAISMISAGRPQKSRKPYLKQKQSSINLKSRAIKTTQKPVATQSRSQNTVNRPQRSSRGGQLVSGGMRQRMPPRALRVSSPTT